MEPAYLAGFIDGEGSFFINFEDSHRKGRALFIIPMLSIGLSKRDKWLLYEFKEQYGGQICIFDNVGSMGKASWQLSKREDLRKLVKLVMPHLRIKKQSAELILKTIEIMDRTKPPISRPVADIFAIAKISDEITSLSFNTKQRRWNYEYIKNFIESNSWYSKYYKDIRSDIGERYGFQRGCIPWNKKHSDEVIEKARELHSQGVGPTEISRRLNVKRGNLSNWIYK